MKEFQCTKCKSTDVFINKSGNNTGLYCGDCGAWITWLNKEQLRLAERFITNERTEGLKEVLKKLSNSNIKEVKEVCEKIGVKIIDEEGNYRNTYDVLKDLSIAFNE